MWGGGGCLCVHVKCLWVCLVPEAMNNHGWTLVKLHSIAVCEERDLCVHDLPVCVPPCSY